ncbi:MAG: hypothetical protein PHD81_03125 [Candidatus Nanoarchaeia archaeon]|nr:hypothetical protein [Candidatus Nanoarchaeia archaeon]MDD5588076.1 hypothetical protein [Candidatus Nanoarchaeia archaeon]
MRSTNEWKTIGRPGWFGESRDEFIKKQDHLYGQGNWRIRHKLGPRTLDFNEAVQLYELSYELDFNHPDRRYIWNELVRTAEDVWTEQLTDLKSGIDYSIQLAPAAHYEDISIRRILDKNHLKFKGDKLIRIRADSEDLIGKILSSIHIPFIYPGYIESSINDKMPWWDRHKGSLECFWHLNKILQVKRKPPLSIEEEFAIYGGEPSS